MKHFIVFCLLLVGSAQARDFTIGGFSETVFIVSDLDEATSFYQTYAGWEVRDDSPVDEKLKQLWKLPAKVNIEQRLMANKGTTTGFVRLVQISGIAQQQIRSNTQSWDIGGIFDVNVRVADMDSKFQQLQLIGWQGDSDPVGFTFGPFEVKEWITRGHDGVSFALIERIKPTLEGWPHLKEFSRVFNSTQVVKDIDKSLIFYRDVLGFQMYLEHKGAGKTAGANVLGLPYNLTTEIPRSVFILHPDKLNEGSVELLQFHGADGKDVSHLAKPPNLGIVTLRFPVTNLLELKKTFEKHNVEIISETTLQLPPYGIVDMLAIRTPDNTWLEFYSSK